MECSIKRFPLGQYSQTVAQAALEVREQLPDPADIASVTVRTLQTALNIMAGDSEKWRPANRETADHSIALHRRRGPDVRSDRPAALRR